MELAIKYTNNRGESIEFGGTQEELHYFETELRDASWSYEIANGIVSTFSKDSAEIEFKVGISADTEAEGLALRDQLIAITEADVLDNVAGRLFVNGWYLKCYVIGRSYEEWYWNGRFCEVTLNVLCVERMWYRDNEKHFVQTDSEGEYTYLDFPFNFPHDLNGTVNVRQIINHSLSSADLLIRIYGAVTAPEVTIAGNVYGVDGTVTLTTNQLLEIDTKAQTVELVDVYGNRTSKLQARKAGAKGSGTYIFEKVPAGELNVSVNKDFAVDVCVYEYASEPEWS